VKRIPETTVHDIVQSEAVDSLLSLDPHLETVGKRLANWAG
jgi:hypothetical protein